MRIWIDVLTPKQVLFFRGVGEKLYEKGYNVFYTIRDFRETVSLSEKYLVDKYNTKMFGEYGGKKLKNKLIASLKRALDLTEYIYKEKVDIALSFTSPEASRVAYGLDIPHISVSDSPHAVAASKLSIPFSKKLYSPWIISKRKWMKYGIDSNRIYQYKGLDPLVWIKRHVDDGELIDKYGLKEKDYIVIRPIEYMASYQLTTNFNRMIDIKKLIIKFIGRSGKEYKIFVIPRYIEQMKVLKRRLEDKIRQVIVLDRVVDGVTLLKHSSGFIGYGGTMTMEAALLGIPTLSARPGRQPECIKYLVKKGLVRRVKTVNEAVETFLDLMKRREEAFEKAMDIVNSMEDPAEYISRTIEEDI